MWELLGREESQLDGSALEVAISTMASGDFLIPKGFVAVDESTLKNINTITSEALLRSGPYTFPTWDWRNLRLRDFPFSYGHGLALGVVKSLIQQDLSAILRMRGEFSAFEFSSKDILDGFPSSAGLEGFGYRATWNGARWLHFSVFLPWFAGQYSISGSVHTHPLSFF